MQPYPAGSWRECVSRYTVRTLVLACLGLPVMAQAAPVANFTTDPNPAEGGTPLSVQFLDLSTGAITSWSWDFNDGTGSGEQNPVHVFVLEQPFDVSLTVTGPGGSSTFLLEHAVDVLPTTNGVAGAPAALSTLVVPMPANIGDFVKDEQAALRLGKALFWDMQLGSDGMTACASCHYHAGADNRVRNTLHPGADGIFDLLASGRGGGPNFSLSSGDFPFRKFLDPNNGEDLIHSTDDRRGTAGVLKKSFAGTGPGVQFDFSKDDLDQTFQVGGTDTLQVTGRDAPTAVGAIFFHRLFWDGRANHFFNGVNIWGNSDPSEPKVLERLPDGSLGEVAILLENAAAASQAVGPPLSGVEMSWTGRSWRDVGRKMVGRRPLASQHVDLQDGVLGDLANPAGPGLRPAVTYAAMIRAAFHERWWESSATSAGFTQMEANFALFFGLAIQSYEATLVPGNAPYDQWANGDLGALDESARRGLDIFVGRGSCINCHGTPLFAGALRDEVRTPDAEAEGALERMAMNNALIAGGISFSLDQGRLRETPALEAPGGGGLLASGIQATSAEGGTRLNGRLVGLYTPDGRLLAWGRLPEGLGCAPAGQQGLTLQPTDLVPPGSEFEAEVRAITDGRCGTTVDFRFAWNETGPAAGIHQLRVAGRRLPVSIAASATAVYDNGFYNIGVSPTSDDPGVGGNSPFGPLAMTRRVQDGEDIGHSPGIPSVAWFERVAVDGSFKTPTLRNVELTGPYMHDGSMATLEQVVEFYTRGGDFATENARELDPDINGIPAMTEQDKADLVAFLKALTDPRVRFEQAPFDHPALMLKEGQVGDHDWVFSDNHANAVPILVHKPATGFTGGAPLKTFEERLPAFVTVAVLEESAFGARIAVVCDKKPAANVTVHFGLSNPALATLSTTTITFTPANWRVGREVLVTTVDPDSAGGSNLVVHTTSAQSSDPAFAGIPVADVALDFLANLSANPATNEDTIGSRQAATTLAPGGARVVDRRQ